MKWLIKHIAMQNEKKPGSGRRKFLKDTTKTIAGTALALHLPAIVPASVFGKNAPSNRINVAAFGTGRISRGQLDDVANRQSVLRRELVIALVVRGHRH